MELSDMIKSAKITDNLQIELTMGWDPSDIV